MIRVSELSGAWLDYWVARAEGTDAVVLEVRAIQRSTELHCVQLGAPAQALNYSTSWEKGGPIIELEHIQLWHRVETGDGNDWHATCSVPWSRFEKAGFEETESGSTPLVAAMRAYVASNYGTEVPEVAP